MATCDKCGSVRLAETDSFEALLTAWREWARAILGVRGLLASDAELMQELKNGLKASEAPAIETSHTSNETVENSLCDLLEAARYGTHQSTSYEEEIDAICKRGDERITALQVKLAAVENTMKFVRSHVSAEVESLKRRCKAIEQSREALVTKLLALDEKGLTSGAK